MTTTSTEAVQPPSIEAGDLRGHPWSLLSNHGLVLVAIARDPNLRVRDIADQVGITERAAHRIVADLAAEGYITRTRVGRRTVYGIHSEVHFRHPSLSAQVVAVLLRIARETTAG